MLIEEFEKMTGIYPTADLYEVIEKKYMEDSRDKVAFCKAFKKNENGMAEAIAREASFAALKKDKDHQEELARHNSRIASLEKQLEREQEWKPTECDSRMTAVQYADLKGCASTKTMTEETARDYIFQEFGFAPATIKIVNELGVYEINRHHQLRKVGTEARPALWNAYDWNYIRFDVRAWKYEVVNGELYKYSE